MKVNLKNSRLIIKKGKEKSKGWVENQEKEAGASKGHSVAELRNEVKVELY